MTNLRQNTINPRLVCPHPAYHPVHPHMFMINHHLQPCVIPHLLTEISESKHHQVVKQVDLGCKGSNPNSLVYPGLPIEMNLMAGMERELTKEVHTTQIEDIMEADLEIWIGIIIETTETIAEMTEGNFQLQSPYCEILCDNSQTFFCDGFEAYCHLMFVVRSSDRLQYLILGTIVGMIAVEDIAEVIETITDEIVEETPDVIEIIVIEAGIEVEIGMLLRFPTYVFTI